MKIQALIHQYVLWTHMHRQQFVYTLNSLLILDNRFYTGYERWTGGFADQQALAFVRQQDSGEPQNAANSDRSDTVQHGYFQVVRNATPRKATRRPSMAALSSKSTVKIVGSLLA